MAINYTITQAGQSVSYTIQEGIGPAGPNNITTSTGTTITGLLKGNGSTVSAATALTDYDTPPVVKAASFTADLNGRYVVDASATVTDPTPAECKGFVVFVRNGTATVGGTAYATAGTIIHRIYHSGAWANYVYKVDSTYAAASHTHVSADITDATDNGRTNPEKVLETDEFGNLEVNALTVGETRFTSGIYTTNLQSGTVAGANKTVTLPNESGNLALVAQTDGTIRGTDLDYSNTTDIGAALADADEVLVSDGGGNTTRKKSALSRFWTYIKAKIESVTLGSITSSGTLTVGSGTWNGSTITGPQTFSGAVTANADVSIRGAAFANAALSVYPQGAAYRGIGIKTAASQTGNALYIEDSSGNARAGFDNVGNYFLYAANNSQGLYMADQTAPGGTEKKCSFTLRGGSSQYLAINAGRDGSNNAGDLLLAYDHGNVGVGNVVPSYKLDVNGSCRVSSDTFIVTTAKTPSSASDTGTQGQIAWDADYIYICTATNTWKRVAISTW